MGGEWTWKIGGILLHTHQLHRSIKILLVNELFYWERLLSVLQQPMTTYRGYRLDPFQSNAIEALSKGQSVLVSAPTGTGKTLIADYLVDRAFHGGEQVVYTAPIKALSNQKFKEFKELLGEEHVGILTGDIVVNPQATVLIMTTEIFRNLLHTDRGRLADVGYVIFDEIHYIDDPVRGSVWEESLIFMPDDMRFLGLSATVPNVDEMARWISDIQGREIVVITHNERAVPLKHHLYEGTLGECTFRQLERRYKRYAARLGVTPGGTIAANFEPTRHVDLIDYIEPDLLPCLYFTFSRRKCEANANELAQFKAFLTADEQEEVKAVIDDFSQRYQGAGSRSLKTIEPLLLLGIGYHHAGLLPVVKDVVEELFQRRLLPVLYCTETFAVGLNFPCKTVCFDSVTKWDGSTFRALSNREYFQMAGRAGRRGIDEVGHVFTAVDFNFFNPDQFPSMREDQVEPVQSRFTLSYNTVLNLINNYELDQIRSILSRNFANFQTEAARLRHQTEVESLSNALMELGGGASMSEAEMFLDYLQKEKDRAKLTRRIERMKKERRRKEARNLGRQLNRLNRELLDMEEMGCTRERVNAFRPKAREYRRAVQRIRRLQRRLSSLPPSDAFMREFDDKRMLLEGLDYIRDGELTSRGLFASEINGSELLVTELFFKGIFHDWDEDELNALAACIDYDPRRGEDRPRKRSFDLGVVKRSVRLIEEMEKTYLGYSTVEFNDHLAPAALIWSRGGTFTEVLEAGGADEGDLVFGFRRAIDVLRQVRQAARYDEAIAAKLSRCIEKMDRDEVSILL